MTTTQAPQPTAPSPTPPQVHVYDFSPRADRGVLALFTGSRADQAAATHAARTGHPVSAAAVVRSIGFTINALLHQARSRRIQAETHAILAAVLPVIARAGPARTTNLVVPARINSYQALPADRVEPLAGHAGTDVILSPVPLTGSTSPTAGELRRITDPHTRSHAMAAGP
ncbi:hypothetical protein [Streptomyces sp. NPDC058595]|uniref:hypothetical protein n=1 Tax=Streptomyces sp. NPDC058595 TaxID=3346550 RepID=UPI00366625C9